MAKKRNPCLYVTLLIDKQVLWLKISVDEIQRVKVFKGQHNLGRVEAGVWFTTEQIMHNCYNWTEVNVNTYQPLLKPPYLNLPILLKCENISPPGTYSIIIYRLLLSYREMSTVLLWHAKLIYKTKWTRLECKQKKCWMNTLKECSSRTRKGKLTACRIRFSFRVCSICFSFTT